MSAEQEDVALQHTLDSNRAELELLSQSQRDAAWLQGKLTSGQGTDQVYEALTRSIEHPDFVEKLHRAREAHTSHSCRQLQGSEVLAESWWQSPDELGPNYPDATELADGFTEVEADTTPSEPLDDYVMVSQEDVVDSIGTFVAAYLMQLPEANKMKPEELQVAIKDALQALRKGRVRRLWEWGRCIYRCIAFSYGAFSVYENPWLVRALLAAIWTASKIILGGAAAIIF
ncbi:hypothetical protein WJX73_001182 [Symbiochloris irregularis]|uniref:Uncharacterized protein n=1 Tax=Symbiochloris irregularis TaxID=706552 RepID=A0AAW1PDG8_9CHLO